MEGARYGETASPPVMDASPYLQELGERVRRDAEGARAALRDAPEAERDFAAGRLLALTTTLTLMCELADAHGLDRGALSLEGIDPERDLLG